jgi:hypothetical protein
MSGPFAEGGPLPPVDREAIAEHERQLDAWQREIEEEEHEPFRVIAVTYIDGEWSVDPEADDPRPGVDPSKVRLALAYDTDSFEVDVPIEVLQRLAKKIGEL